MPDKELERLLPSDVGAGREGHRMAQDNVAQRLGAFFAGDASLAAEHAHERYRVVLDVPYEGGMNG